MPRGPPMRMSLRVFQHLQGRREGSLRGRPFLPPTLSYKWRKYNGNIYSKSRQLCPDASAV